MDENKQTRIEKKFLPVSSRGGAKTNLVRRMRGGTKNNFVRRTRSTYGCGTHVKRSKMCGDENRSPPGPKKYELRRTRIELATFLSGVRRATIAPPPRGVSPNRAPAACASLPQRSDSPGALRRTPSLTTSLVQILSQLYHVHAFAASLPCSGQTGTCW